MTNFFRTTITLTVTRASRDLLGNCELCFVCHEARQESNDIGRRIECKGNV